MAENCRLTERLLDISTNYFLVTDVSGTIIYTNQRIKTLFERSNPQNLLELWGADLTSQVLEIIRDCLKRQQPRQTCLEYRERIYQLFFYPDDKICLQCIEDITERRQLSASLQKISHRMEFAEKTAKIGYWELSLKHRKVFWSSEMYRIFGVPINSRSSKIQIIHRLADQEDFPEYKKNIHNLLRTGIPASGQLRVRRQDGQLVYCIYNAQIICESGMIKIAGTFQDLSSQEQIRQELQQAKNHAEKLNRDKSYFLAMASHDLRQPMQALNIFIQTLFSEGLNSHQSAILEKIEASADNLKNLLDNLLDISKLESGGVKYEPIRFNIGQLLANISKEYRELAHFRQIKFHALLHSGEVYTDPVLVERIIRNLLSNAFKYTNSKIVLGCKRFENCFRVMILDNGPGLTQEEQQKIFEEFYQCPQQPESRKQGAGLGLTIVKKIAKIIGTEIRIDTVPGRGTCFSFLIPIARA